MTEPSTPAGWYPDPGGAPGERYWDGAEWTENRREAVAVEGATPPDFTPSAVTPPPAAKSGGVDKQMLLVFGICAAVVLIMGAITAVVWVMRAGDVVDKVNADISSSIANLPSLTSAKPTAKASVGEEVGDGNLGFVVEGTNFASVVEDRDDPSITVSPQGVFVIVDIKVTNTGTEPAQFMASLQKLTAGGSVYEASTDAGVYLGGIYEDINPGDEIHAKVAYDVPIGTAPESIELHGAPFSNGAVVRF